MKKVLVGMLIGLGLVTGFGFEASACESKCDSNSCGEYQCALCEEQYCMEEDCNVTCECGIEVFELEVDYIAEHKENDKCTDNHFLCENCGAFFCLTEDCWCGEYEVSNRYIYEEIFANEMNIVMTQEELSAFKCYVWNELYMKSCVNYCEECDIEYYEHCSCECRKECEEEGYRFTPEDEEYCWEYDYQLFVEDNYDMIMDIYEELLEEKQERIVAKEKEETVMIICEF
jgi:hypothetical protein